jgi:hypothetical protein
MINIEYVTTIVNIDSRMKNEEWRKEKNGDVSIVKFFKIINRHN